MSNIKKIKGYHQFMCHKDFHPANWRNLKLVFEAREKEKKQQKIAEERNEEYRREQDDLEDQALLGDEKAKHKIQFIYKPPPGIKPKEKEGPEPKFEWQRKYNGPREDWVKENDAPWMTLMQDKPFGIMVRHTFCKKCKEWGHLAVDKECPNYDKLHKDGESSRPSDLIKQTRKARENKVEVDDNQKPSTLCGDIDAEIKRIMREKMKAEYIKLMQSQAAEDMKQRFEDIQDELFENIKPNVKCEDDSAEQTTSNADTEKAEIASYLLTTAKDFDTNPHELARQMATDYKMTIKSHLINSINLDRNIVNYGKKSFEDENTYDSNQRNNGANVDVQNYLSTMSKKDQKLLFKRFFEESDDVKKEVMIKKEEYPFEDRRKPKLKKEKKRISKKDEESSYEPTGRKSKKKKSKKKKIGKEKSDRKRSRLLFEGETELEEPLKKHCRTVVIEDGECSHSTSSSLSTTDNNDTSDYTTSEDEAALMRQVLLKRRVAALQEKRKAMKLDLKRMRDH